MPCQWLAPGLCLFMLLLACSQTVALASDQAANDKTTGSETTGVAPERGWSDTEPTEGPSVKHGKRWMVPYKLCVPGSDAVIEMIPVRGGVFTMGSSADATGTANASADERPQRQIRVEPFWIGKTEITWGQYQPYMDLLDLARHWEVKGVRQVAEANRVDAVTIPSAIYAPEWHYDKGEEPGHPAVTMTQYAAKQYTKWLALMYREGYRLPTEAEWEYACRAGTTTAYSFGDDPAQLGEYASYLSNSDNVNEPLPEVGTKKPNPWGLYDMHGSAAEWTLDGYSKEGYPQAAADDGSAAAPGDRPLTIWEAVVWPTKPYARTLRGGSWNNSAAGCRSASRMPSNDKLWYQDDLPDSMGLWWFYDKGAQCVGFRLVRQIEPIDAKLRSKVWEADTDALRESLRTYESNGNVRWLQTDPDLPALLDQHRKQQQANSSDQKP